ncbi:MAG: hypothetical protein WDA71_03660 [Actinomycetota bacterium]|jgi:MFS family permease
MKTAQDALQWAAAGAFLILAAAAIVDWLDRRERASSHLAWAMGLFGGGTLAQAILSAVYPAGAVRLFPPHGLRIMVPILIVLATYAFLLFLADFVRFPWWAHGAAIAAALLFVVLSAIERPDIAIVNFKIVAVHVSNVMGFVDFAKLLYLYLAVVFGILALAFGVYGVRAGGRVRARMLLVAAGFLLLFLSAGVTPRLLIGRPSTTTIQWVILMVWVLDILSAPLLFFGFTPPSALMRRSRPGGEEPAATS